MFLSFLLLAALAGCEREPPDLDPESPEARALEEAFCRDVYEGLALLMEVEEAKDRDSLLYQKTRQHPLGGHLLCPHIENQQDQGRCEAFLSRPHMWPSGAIPATIKDCPALSGWSGPRELVCDACDDAERRPGAPVIRLKRAREVSSVLLEVEPEGSRAAAAEVASQGEKGVKHCFNDVPPDCSCPAGTLTLLAEHGQGRVLGVLVQGGSLRSAERFTSCMQSWLALHSRLPAGSSGSFTVEYRLRGW